MGPDHADDDRRCCVLMGVDRTNEHIVCRTRRGDDCYRDCDEADTDGPMKIVAAVPLMDLEVEELIDRMILAEDANHTASQNREANACLESKGFAMLNSVEDEDVQEVGVLGQYETSDNESGPIEEAVGVEIVHHILVDRVMTSQEGMKEEKDERSGERETVGHSVHVDPETSGEDTCRLTGSKVDLAQTRRNGEHDGWRC